MTKNELITKVADELSGLEFTSFDVKSILEKVFYNIYHGVVKEGKVNVGAFIFKKVTRKARKARNPRTGETIDVPASESIVCRVKLP